jgi:hypothetical protein
MAYLQQMTGGYADQHNPLHVAGPVSYPCIPCICMNPDMNHVAATNATAAAAAAALPVLPSSL